MTHSPPRRVAAPLFLVTLLSSSISAALGENLEDSLAIVARRFDVHVLYDSSLTAGITSREVPMDLSLEETLHALVDGTGLSFRVTHGRVVTLEGKKTVPDPVDNEVLITGAHIAGMEVMITDSHITGTPMGSKIITLNRADFERSRFATVSDALQSLTQNATRGPGDDEWASSLDRVSYATGASGLNLRGLGGSSTLVLINGRRLAAGAGDGRFADISGIPLTAVDRIEVLPYGASTIYGADAVGGVVNFVMRDDYDGTESRMQYGLATSGSPTDFEVAQMLGTNWGTGSALISIEFGKRSALAAADRAQSRNSDLRSLGGDDFSLPDGNQNKGTDVLPRHRRWSLVGSLSQNISDRTQLVSDVLLSQHNTDVRLQPTPTTLMVPSSNPFYENLDHENEPVLVAYSSGRDLGPEVETAKVFTGSASIGLLMVLDSWKVSSQVSYAIAADLVRTGALIDPLSLAAALADPNPETAFNPFDHGSLTNARTLERIRGDALIARRHGIRSIDFTTEGTVGQWFDRDIRAALGLDLRNERVRSLGERDNLITMDQHAARNVYSAYTEMLMPLIGGLEISLAGRYEHFSDFGGALVPKIGLNWSPLNNFALHGSWAQSVKVPNLVELDESRNFSLLSAQANRLVDTGFSPVLVRFGNNAELQTARATTWNIGVNLSPTPDLSVGLTYFDIRYTNVIDRIDYSSFILEDPSLADAVNTNPSRAQREEICFNSRFIGHTDDCMTAPVDALIDLRIANSAFIKTSGIDAFTAYEMHSRFGRFDARLGTSYLLDFSKSRRAGVPSMSLLDTGGHPLRFRCRGELSWDIGAWIMSSALNYSGSYVDSVSVPHRSVGSWMTVDVGVQFEITQGSHIGIYVQNVLNQNAPFFNNPIGVGYDPQNANLLQRFVSVGLRKEW